MLIGATSRYNTEVHQHIWRIRRTSDGIFPCVHTQVPLSNFQSSVPQPLSVPFGTDRLSHVLTGSGRWSQKIPCGSGVASRVFGGGTERRGPTDLESLLQVGRRKTMKMSKKALEEEHAVCQKPGRGAQVVGAAWMANGATLLGLSWWSGPQRAGRAQCLQSVHHSAGTAAPMPTCCSLVRAEASPPHSRLQVLGLLLPPLPHTYRPPWNSTPPRSRGVRAGVAHRRKMAGSSAPLTHPGVSSPDKASCIPAPDACCCYLWEMEILLLKRSEQFLSNLFWAIANFPSNVLSFIDRCHIDNEQCKLTTESLLHACCLLSC